MQLGNPKAQALAWSVLWLWALALLSAAVPGLANEYPGGVLFEVLPGQASESAPAFGFCQLRDADAPPPDPTSYCPYFEPVHAPQRELGHKLPVVLLHGFKPYDLGSDDGASRRVLRIHWTKFSQYFFENKLDQDFTLYAYRYNYDNFVYDAGRGVDDNGERFGRLVEQVFGNNRNLIFIGYSTGGLIARSFMEEYRYQTYASDLGGEHTLGLITLATPFHGTPLAIPLKSLGRAIPSLSCIATLFPNKDEPGSIDLQWDGYNSELNLPAYEPLRRFNELTRYLSKITAYGGGGTAQSLNVAYLMSSDRCLSQLGFEQNDGVVPLDSALFDGAGWQSQIRWRGPFEQHNHFYMHGTGLADVLFDHLDHDLERLASQAVAPEPPKDLAARVQPDGSVAVSFTLPDDANLTGVVVQKKTTDLPRHASDGKRLFADFAPRAGKRVALRDPGPAEGEVSHYAVFLLGAAHSWRRAAVTVTVDGATPVEARAWWLRVWDAILSTLRHMWAMRANLR